MVSLDSPLGRAIQKVAGSSAFAKVGPHVVPHVDRVVNRLSGGRFVLSAGLLPSLVLHTTGAKTGQPRTTPLATMLDKGHDGGTSEAFYVVGSNFGRDNHPAWTANLIKHPEASVTFRGRTIPVHAHLLSAAEKQEIWPRLTAFWPNYDVYTERSHRDLRVFRLAPR